MKKFKRCYIEITNVCNLSCSFCPPTTRTPQFMRIETFANILDKIKNHTQHLYFHIKGEPLLHPDIEQFLIICHEKGFKVNMTTNGTMIKQVKERLLNKPALRKVSFSLQSIEGNEECKKRYISDILEFVKEANENTKIIIELRLWNLDRHTVSEDRKNDYLLEKIEEFLDTSFKIEEKISQSQGIKLKERLYLSQSYVFEWPDIEKEDISDKGFCYGLKDQIGILVDGTVVPCCLDAKGDINLGNINDGVGFEEIINSKRAEEITKGFSERKVIEPLCRKCGYRAMK